MMKGYSYKLYVEIKEGWVSPNPITDMLEVGQAGETLLYSADQQQGLLFNSQAQLQPQSMRDTL